ncbi:MULTISPECIES: hypothetical protein [Rhizobium/Agrobacterium group]|jgi:hypothetical protein|uniref:Uncharacterized protein n=2 Tax=Rhizobium/Agrobacterium group TaxID=227290 RepID=A0AA44J7F2_AGRTU|nr:MULTISPECIES: hypothetical protein [Rhizobium/Agrobacterium group]AKC09991.1 hypothetical protein Ach5_42180 [Agrobacterium tumefaciens]ADY67558.1 hypothetical protein AGROH133_13869 [Agrobacterium tumefaciens]AYM19135.1 hypothetical protein At15955_41500 [Agrobacterium tumefaciens]AYM70434.1 hypothetical protein AtA6_42180 [Agrobacterium tumefaciens]KAA3525630.1 hypothetical protein DXM29_17610 [Agrobacterium tumefaciens]
MGEYQNKAVDLMRNRVGDSILNNKIERREAFLRKALALYHVMGGAADGMRAAVEDVVHLPKPSVDVAVGDVMHELAAIGHVADLDIIQAGYNKLDAANLHILSKGKRLLQKQQEKKLAATAEK